jgi:hypothetical protein
VPRGSTSNWETWWPSACALSDMSDAAPERIRGLDTVLDDDARG